MPKEILMPAMSPTMTEGTLASWLAKEGDKVAAGDVIAEIETDKATMELEAVDEGTLGRILVDAGTENVPVNKAIALLLEDGEDKSALESFEVSKPELPDMDQESESEPEPEPESQARPERLAPAMPAEQDIPEGTSFAELTVREALRDAMAEEMRRDDTVFLMGEEVAEYQGAYKVSQGLLEEFGSRRVVDTPITEHGFAGLGVGASMGGLRPIVEFMTFNFAMQAMDQLINSAAKSRYMSGGQIGCPIVFRGPNGAASRVAAQHSQNYIAWFAHVPGLKVIAPYSAADAKGLLKSAIRDPNPVMFLENEILYGRKFDVPEFDDFTVPIGKANVVREGADVTIVAYSIAVGFCLDAADALAADGIEAEVIDLRTIRPLDIETVLESVKKTNRLVVAEEDWPFCGIGAELAAEVSFRVFDYLDAPVVRVSNADTPTPYAANLEKFWLVKSEDIAKAAKSVCYAD